MKKILLGTAMLILLGAGCASYQPKPDRAEIINEQPVGPSVTLTMAQLLEIKQRAETATLTAPEVQAAYGAPEMYVATGAWRYRTGNGELAEFRFNATGQLIQITYQGTAFLCLNDPMATCQSLKTQ